MHFQETYIWSHSGVWPQIMWQKFLILPITISNLSKDSWDQFIKIFVWFFFWSLCSNPWMNWKISKQSNLWLSENFEYFQKRIQFQKILFRNQCRYKWAFRRYASCRSVFGLRRDICIHRKWITIYPYLSKNQMDNHCSALDNRQGWI
jgi:hypothetical protein